MSSIIKQIGKKIKHFLIKIVDFLGKDIVFYSLLIIFASSISFLLGSLSEFHKNQKKDIEAVQLLHSSSEKKIYYVASKRGKKYFLP